MSEAIRNESHHVRRAANMRLALYCSVFLLGTNAASHLCFASPADPIQLFGEEAGVTLVDPSAGAYDPGYETPR